MFRCFALHSFFVSFLFSLLLSLFRAQDQVLIEGFFGDPFRTLLDARGVNIRVIPSRENRPTQHPLTPRHDPYLGKRVRLSTRVTPRLFKIFDIFFEFSPESAVKPERVPCVRKSPLPKPVLALDFLDAPEKLARDLPNHTLAHRRQPFPGQLCRYVRGQRFQIQSGVVGTSVANRVRKTNAQTFSFEHFDQSLPARSSVKINRRAIPGRRDRFLNRIANKRRRRAPVMNSCGFAHFFLGRVQKRLGLHLRGKHVVTPRGALS
ncbi:MAG: hypothetical protein BWY49_00130 [Candidatus Omnitrophica bacterium ADurb.Bin314]|nr:MAG: hypothetical protein BWY49_00130 [Candidatus Omnitrophica bacterium ADurb.Bin314]